MKHPESIADWLALCRQHEEAAKAIAENKVAAGQSIQHVGFAVECALKAYIWHVERFNQWPSRDARPDLYTHDLRKLRAIAGIQLDPAEPNAAHWHIVLQWDRNQGYDPKPMPRRVARSFVEAAFGSDGVATWLRLKLKNAS